MSTKVPRGRGPALRVPMEPLLRQMQLKYGERNIVKFARVLDVDPTVLHYFIRFGVTLRRADEMAIVIGLHPALVWGDDWWRITGGGLPVEGGAEMPPRPPSRSRPGGVPPRRQPPSSCAASGVVEAVGGEGRGRTGEPGRVMMWRFGTGSGYWRYLASAHLPAHSMMALVAPEGYVVARWYSGTEAEIVRGQWISPMGDLQLKALGTVLPLDAEAEEHAVQQEVERLGITWAADGHGAQAMIGDHGPSQRSPR